MEQIKDIGTIGVKDDYRINMFLQCVKFIKLMLESATFIIEDNFLK
jgi:hypothetical protein